jgi:hypothetical protein
MTRAEVGKEMHSIVPRPPSVDEADEAFIDERKGLQAVPDALTAATAARACGGLTRTSGISC